ncbi:MAG TPA: Uma2 family endonuclease [Allosphingosinicella sp.]|jgi:Uma2 family endonuclease
MTVLEETPARFTADEFLEIAARPPISDWLGKVELVHGIIVRMGPAHVPHWNAQRVLYERLYEIVRRASQEWVLGVEPAVRLAGDTIREPDIALLKDPDLSGKLIDRTALFLAVEIADSSLVGDGTVKQRSYAEAHVPHYWVVDLETRVIHVMSHPRHGDYREGKSVPFGVAVDVPGVGGTIVVD